MDIIINVESQEWLAENHTPSDSDLSNPAKNQMKVDWVRVYKPVVSKNSNVKVTGITVSPSQLSLNVGATGYLIGAVAPSNATDQTMTFTSSNLAVATVKRYSAHSPFIISLISTPAFTETPFWLSKDSALIVAVPSISKTAPVLTGL